MKTDVIFVKLITAAAQKQPKTVQIKLKESRTVQRGPSSVDNPYPPPEP